MDARTARVERMPTELHNGGQAFGPHKTAAGRLVVGFPELIAPVVRWHLGRAMESVLGAGAPPQGKPS
jgi:hypothetical protein